LIESTITFLIQTLKRGFKDLKEWLNPQSCERTVQRSEHAETGTICMGSLLDLHIHTDYEAVERDEGLVVRATVRPIRMTEASEQQ
jgi:hypothetical protein